MQWVLFMHFSLAFIQASVMCWLKCFKVFLQPSGVIPPYPCLWGSSSWTCVARNGLTSQLVKISSQSSHYLPPCAFVHIKELQVPASEVPGSEVWFKAHIKPNGQVWLVFFYKLNQESCRTWNWSSHCSYTDSPGPSCFWASCTAWGARTGAASVTPVFWG